MRCACYSKPLTLQQTADGKFSLGALDAVANDKLDARFECAPSVFSRRQLGAFR